MKTLLLSVFLTSILLSCKKDDETPNPEISALFVPAEGDTIHGGNPFAIDGTLSSDQTLLGYQVSVFDVEGDSTLYQRTVMDSSTTYTVHELVPHFFDTLVELKFELTIFADGQQGKHEHNFYYKP